MPELPEVETLVRGVKSDLVGKAFSKVVFLREDIREPIPIKRLKEILEHHKITSVTRRGKYLLLKTSKGYLGVHLGMSGKFVRNKAKDVVVKHTHAIFEINESMQYRFIDARRFGRLFNIEIGEEATHPFLEKLGLEPLENASVLGKHLYDSSRKRTQEVKVFLMDSHVVVGVGNIYASETLWRAKINPHRKANELSPAQYEKIAKQVIEVLTEAILAGGTTFRDYRNNDDKLGSFQMNLAVYGREAKPCARCGQNIVKTVQAARSTYHCKICQK